VHLLGAVREKYNSQHQSKNSYGSVVVRRYEFARILAASEDGAVCARRGEQSQNEQSQNDKQGLQDRLLKTAG
jgi:hypothetical protein